MRNSDWSSDVCSSDLFRPKTSIQRVGRDNLLNMVAKGFGITLTTHSTVGAIYPGVSFLPISDAAQVVSSSVVWSETNQNPALKRLLELASSHASRRKQASRSEEHTSELQSLMRISYAVF